MPSNPEKDTQKAPSVSEKERKDEVGLVAVFRMDLNKVVDEECSDYD